MRTTTTIPRLQASFVPARCIGHQSPYTHHQAHHRDHSIPPHANSQLSSIFILNTGAEIWENTYRGYKTLMPTFDASAPVTKGKNADPACPKPAIQPMHPVRSQGGRTCRAWFITSGYMGPSNIPTNETASAPPMSEGTNHTTISSLLRAHIVNLEKGEGDGVGVGDGSSPDGEDAVEEDDALLADELVHPEQSEAAHH